MLLILALFGPVFSLFSETTHKFHVSEDSPSGTSLGKMPLPEDIDFRLSGLPPELRFERGEVFLERAVDREQTPTLSFSLVSSSPPTIVHVVVAVDDVNDNAPTFPLSFQNVSVLETAPVGTRLPLVAAVDLDKAENGQIVAYRLLEGGEGKFQLVTEDGLVFLELQESLDREQKELYSFNLTATDGGTPARTGWTAVYVQVLDVNDCAPEFQQKRAVVDWNGQTDTPLVTLNATDCDSGPNAHIFYEIVGFPPSQDFEIRDGALFSRASSPSCCPSPPCLECTLTIRATDGGNPPLSTTAEVHVRLHGTNQHDPDIQIRLQPSHVDFAVISHNDEAGKAMAVLTVTDGDGLLGAEGGLRIVEDEGLFVLNAQPTFSILRLAVPGKNLTKSEYRVTFEASDGQRPPRQSSRTLTVYKEGQKTAPKKIVQMTVRMAEDAPQGSFVTQVGANSTGQRFTLTSKSLLLEVDEVNGIVTTSVSSLPSGHLTFDVSVFPPPPAVQPYLVTVDLLVLAANKPANKTHLQPSLLSSRLEFNITSSTPLGVPLVTLYCEKGKRCSFSTDCPFLAVDSSGILRLSRVFSTDKMVCSARSIDNGGKEVKMDVVVRKEEAEDELRLAPSYEYYLQDHLPLGTVVGRLPSTASHLYSIKDAGEIGLFPDGVLFVRRKLKPMEVYSFLVEATHSRLGNRLKAEVWVRTGWHTVEGIDCPVRNFTVKENAPAGSTLGFLHYPNSVKIRQLDNHDHFYVSSIGRIVALKSFDAEKVASFSLKLEFSTGKLKSVCWTHVAVEDVNEFAPEFEEHFYRRSIPFGKFSGSIGSAKAKDRDRDGHRISYRLLDHREFFKVNQTTGELLLRASLPPDSVLNVTIRATDNGNPPLRSTTFFLISTEEDPNSPVVFLDNSTIRISLSARVGTIVGRVIASSGQKTLRILSEDPIFSVDSFGFIRLLTKPKNLPREFEVAFSSGNAQQNRRMRVSDSITVKENSAPFRVQSVPNGTTIVLQTPSDDSFILDKGHLVVNRPLDREKDPFHQILMETAGEYSLLNVEVEDEADSLPQCGSNIFLVEDVPTTLRINCWAVDVNSTVRYQLKRKETGIAVGENGLVRIDKLEEVVNTVRIEVGNGKTKPITVPVTLVKKREDPSITFPSDNFNLLLSSSLENGQSFGRVAAEADTHLEYYLHGSDTLSVKKATGELIVVNRTNIQMDPEAREVVLIATSRIGIASVKIRVEIVEDALVLKRNVFVFEARSSLLGAFVGELRTGGKNVRYECRDERFFVQGEQLFLRKSLRNETKRLLTVEVEATRGRISSKITAYIVLPKENGPLQFSVPENLPKNTVVGEVPDGFESLKGNVPLVVGEDGILRTTESLDREKASSYNFTLQSESGDLLQASLSVDDENDNPPLLSKNQVHLDVAENQQLGAPLTRINFSDSDTSNFFHWTIEEGNELGQFELDRWGLLSLRAPLDFEKAREHKLKIILKDGAAPFEYHSVSVRVHVTVLDVNDTPPRLSSSRSFSVAEDAPLGTTIGSLTAEDSDSTSFPFRIVPETLPHAEFSVDPLFGYLQVDKELDYERESNYSFSVEISDGELATVERVTVAVLDRNDNPPRFKGNATRFSVKETAAIGHVITRLEISDRDGEDNSRSIFWLSGENTKFRVGEINGVVYVAGKLDYEQAREHRLTVHARNIAEGTAIITRNVTISIEDENDESPRFLKGSPQSLEVYENLPGPFPMVISTSVSEDRDKDDPVTYSLLSGNTSLFAVDSKTGDILLLAALDREQQERYQLTVGAKDTGPLRRPSEADILIHVLDDNDQLPEFSQPYYKSSLVENSPNGTVVLQVRAMDKDLDENGEISYRIVEDHVPFWINRASGEIVVRGVVDREKKELWQLTVEARDGGRFTQLSSTTTVRVSIEDQNDNPPAIRNAQMDVFIDGKLKRGEVVHVVDVDDPDLDIISLSLTGPDAKNFDILKGGEIVSLLDSLLMKSFYSLTVTADDSGSHSTSTTFTFYVDDAVFPKFKGLSPVTVPENSMGPVATFTATTAKKLPANKLQYSILAGNDGSFKVDELKGTLYLARPLDRERKDSYRLWIKATDSDTPSKSSISSLDIRVQDVNDQAPEFTQAVYHARIVENVEPQELVTVSAHDQDLGPNAIIKYKITGGNEAGLFSIDQRGVARTLRPLDREEVAEHRLTVTATDSGSPALSAESLIRVQVQDEDDNSPKFTRLFHAEIPEDSKLGSEVVLVSATDIDGSSSHNFSLEDGEGAFAINRTTGMISLLQPLDREKIPSYRIRVRLEDGVWTIFTSVQITISDVNDNGPVFDLPAYIFTVDPGSSSKTCGQVRATDLDEGSNGLVGYSLLEDHPVLSIDPLTGAMPCLGRGNRVVDKVTVIARDSGIPSRSTSVTVWLLREYSQVPPLTVVFPKWTEIGETVWKLPIFEDFLISSPFFNLSNGSLILARPVEVSSLLPTTPAGSLSYARGDEVFLLPLMVKLLDKASTAPKFPSRMVRLTVKDGSSPGTHLGKLEVQTEEWHQFTVNSELISVTEKGVILVAKELQTGETEKEYNLTIGVEDLQGRSDSVRLLLKVIPSLEDHRKLEHRLHPLIFFGTSSTCLPVQDTSTDLVSLSDSVEIDPVGCLDLIETLPEELVLPEGARTISVPILDGRTVPNMTVPVFEASSSSISSKASEHLPRVVFLRENSPGQKISRTIPSGETDPRLQITDPELRKVFKIEENVISSLIPMDREQKTFHTVPLRSSKGTNYTVRILVDDVIDSPPLSSSNLSVYLFGQIKKEAHGLIHPASLDTVHDFRCASLGNASIRVSTSCEMTFQEIPTGTLTLEARRNEESVVYAARFFHKKLRILRLDSALHLSIFGPPDGMASFLSGLHSSFPDLKFYPIGVALKEQYFYTLVMGVADRHDRVVAIQEAQRVVDSFLASHPVLELLPPEKWDCSHRSMKINHSGRHLSFRGSDSLWFVPEGKVEMSCNNGTEPIIASSTPQSKIPESCSKATCPGICSLENGNVACLRGGEEDLCGDTSAISLSDGHVDLIPTPMFPFLIQKNLEGECNDTWIRLDFKTQRDGTLLSVENGHGFRSSLEILAGVPTYRVSDGFRTPVEVPLTQGVVDGLWHTLVFKMTNGGRRVMLEVDGMGREARTKKELPPVLSEDLRRVQIGAGASGKRFSGCIRRLFLNDLPVPLHGATDDDDPLFSISAVGHISWNNGSNPPFRLSPSSIAVLAALLALLAVTALVYGASRLYFRWKEDKGPAWQETRDINAITVRPVPPKLSPSTSTDSHIYDVADRVGRLQETSFEREPTLPIRKIRTVADVMLEIPRSSPTRQPYYRNEGYV